MNRPVAVFGASGPTGRHVVLSGVAGDIAQPETPVAWRMLLEAVP